MDVRMQSDRRVGSAAPATASTQLLAICRVVIASCCHVATRRCVLIAATPIQPKASSAISNLEAKNHLCRTLMQETASLHSSDVALSTPW